MNARNGPEMDQKWSRINSFTWSIPPPTGELLNEHTLVNPPRGGWLHRGPRWRVACDPARPLESSTPFSDGYFVVLP
jgi:hypothetical protein